MPLKSWLPLLVQCRFLSQSTVSYTLFLDGYAIFKTFIFVIKSRKPPILGKPLWLLWAGVEKFLIDLEIRKKKIWLWPTTSEKATYFYFLTLREFYMRHWYSHP